MDKTLNDLRQQLDEPKADPREVQDEFRRSDDVLEKGSEAYYQNVAEQLAAGDETLDANITSLDDEELKIVIAYFQRHGDFAKSLAKSRGLSTEATKPTEALKPTTSATESPSKPVETVENLRDVKPQMAVIAKQLQAFNAGKFDVVSTDVRFAAIDFMQRQDDPAPIFPSEVPFEIDTKGNSQSAAKIVEVVNNCHQPQIKAEVVGGNRVRILITGKPPEQPVSQPETVQATEPVWKQPLQELSLALDSLSAGEYKNFVEAIKHRVSESLQDNTFPEPLEITFGMGYELGTQARDFFKALEALNSSSIDYQLSMPMGQTVETPDQRDKVINYKVLIVFKKPDIAASPANKAVDSAEAPHSIEVPEDGFIIPIADIKANPEKGIILGRLNMDDDKKPDFDVTFGQPGNKDVSKHHAAIKLDGDKFKIVDVGSSNGTFVNGARVSSATLEPTQIIRFGNSWSFKVVSADPQRGLVFGRV